MTRQLTIDGREVDHPLSRPRPLTDQQRATLAHIRHAIVVRPRDLGPYGSAQLARLERRGLVERVTHGWWQATPGGEDWT